MKQLLYTSCQAGRSVNGSTGFQVRACSPDLQGRVLDKAIALARYELPDGMTATMETVPQAPVRLAWLGVADQGYALCHSVYVGLEPSGNRFGNYFSHMVLGTPEDFHAGLAIRTWGSSFWKRRDDDTGGTSLEEAAAPDLKEGAALTNEKLRTFVKTEDGQKLFRFVLTGVLRRRPEQRIFVAANAEDVALCIFGCSCVLPMPLLKDLTFTTYEKSPLSSPASVVGTCWEQGLKLDLPSSCYSGSGIAYNFYSKKQSEPPLPEPPYVDNACRLLIEDPKNRELFLETCKKLSLSNDEQLSFFYTRFCQKNGMAGLTRAESQIALAHPPLATQIVKNGTALDKIVVWAREDADYFREFWPRAQKPLESLVQARQSLLEDMQELSEENRDVAQKWLSWERFQTEPALTEEMLQRMAEALSHMPEKAKAKRLDDLIGSVFNALYTLSKTNTIDDELELFLHHVGAETPGGAGALFGMFCKRIRSESKSFWNRPYFLVSLVAIGLGAVRSENTVSQDVANELEESQVEEVRRLLRDVKTRVGGPKALEMLRREGKGWKQNRVARERLMRIVPVPFKKRLWNWLSGNWLVVLLGLLFLVVVGGGVSVFLLLQSFKVI